MNVEIGAEAALFPEKEYINGFAVAVRAPKCGRDISCCLDYGSWVKNSNSNFESMTMTPWLFNNLCKEQDANVVINILIWASCVQKWVIGGLGDRVTTKKRVVWGQTVCKFSLVSNLFFFLFKSFVIKHLRQPDLKWIQADAVQLSIKIQPKMTASLYIEKQLFLGLSSSLECMAQISWRH